MPEPASPAQAVLEALGFALFAREKSGALTLLGEAPGWLAELWPQLKSEMRTLPVAEDTAREGERAHFRQRREKRGRSKCRWRTETQFRL